jgi:hypothetical protein
MVVTIFTILWLGFTIIIIPYSVYCGLVGKPLFKRREDNYLKGYQFEHNKPAKKELPYYVIDEIQANEESIRLNHALIEHYNELIEITINYNERLKYYKKVADLKVKTAKLEKKAFELNEKWR